MWYHEISRNVYQHIKTNILELWVCNKKILRPNEIKLMVVPISAFKPKVCKIRSDGLPFRGEVDMPKKEKQKKIPVGRCTVAQCAQEADCTFLYMGRNGNKKRNNN